MSVLFGLRISHLLFPPTLVFVLLNFFNFFLNKYMHSYIHPYISDPSFHPSLFHSQSHIQILFLGKISSSKYVIICLCLAQSVYSFSLCLLFFSHLTKEQHPSLSLFLSPSLPPFSNTHSCLEVFDGQSKLGSPCQFCDV